MLYRVILRDCLTNLCKNIELIFDRALYRKGGTRQFLTLVGI